MKGETYIGEKIENYLVNTQSRIITDTRIAEQINRLTKTEKDILLLIAQNISSKEIAAKLFISDSTVKNHRHNILKKLDLGGDQNSLLKFAIQNSMFLK